MGAMRPFNKGIIMTTKRTKKNEVLKSEVDAIAIGNILAMASEEDKKRILEELGVKYQSVSDSKNTTPKFGKYVSPKTGITYYTIRHYDFNNDGYYDKANILGTIDQINALAESWDKLIEFIDNN
jgi:hypothetical protein